MKVINLKLCQIVPGVNYSRSRDLDPSDLIRSITEKGEDGKPRGLICPLVVTASEPHTLISGFQRFAALEKIAKSEGSWETAEAPASLFSGSPVDAAFLNLGENTDRTEITIYDQGKAWVRIQKDFDLSLEDLIVRSGKSRTHVVNCMSIVQRLCPEVRAELDAGLPVPAAKLILWKGLKPELQQRELAQWKTSKKADAPKKTRVRPNTLQKQTMLDRARQCARRTDLLIAATADYILGNRSNPP
jgi:ParB-like chromosome segregation protein Spo0J